jgi:hypothetical protein
MLAHNPAPPSGTRYGLQDPPFPSPLAISIQVFPSHELLKLDLPLAATLLQATLTNGHTLEKSSEAPTFGNDGKNFVRPLSALSLLLSNVKLDTFGSAAVSSWQTVGASGLALGHGLHGGSHSLGMD